MNDNHAHDWELLDKVERLLHDGQPANDPLLDEMAALQPRPRAEFQHTLEDRLAALLPVQPTTEPTQEHERMQLIQQPQITRPVFRFSLPLTLAAAVAVTLIGAALLFGGGQRPSQPGFGAQAVMSETPTEPPTATPVLNEMELTATAVIAEATQRAAVEPVAIHIEPTVLPPTVPPPAVMPLDITATPVPAQQQQPYNVSVLIARDDLPAGTQITADMLILTYWPQDSAPAGSFAEVDALAGQYLQRDLPRWQPVLAADVGDAAPQIPVVTATPVGQ